MKEFLFDHLEIISIIASVIILSIIAACSKTEINTPSSHQVEYNYVIQRHEDTLFFYKIVGIQNGVILIENTPIAKGITRDCDYNF